MASSLGNGNELKPTASGSEADSLALRVRLVARALAVVHGLRVALTALALLAAMAILGISANALAVYRYTYLPADYFLPLWPDSFDIRPTMALVAAAAIVAVANAVSLCASKTCSFRGRAGVHASVSLAAPALGFLAVLVAVAFFYAINASTTVDTLHSWTCRWKQVAMTTRPHFGTLCRQSRAALTLAILLGPLQLSGLAMAGLQVMLERRVRGANEDGPAVP